MSSANQRLNFWEYLIDEKGYRPRSITKKKLEKIKDDVLADDDFWFQVIERFDGELCFNGSRFYDSYPKENTEGSRSNFWAMIRERVVE